MADSLAGDLAGLVLAAGAGTRLRPLTRERPKALCPVGGVPLVDLAVARVRPLVDEVAVNVHHGRALLEAHLALGEDVRVSVEAEQALGTAGAVGALRDWIDGRGVVVVNADAWCPDPLDRLVEGWDGERVRVLVVGADELAPRVLVAGSLLPWEAAQTLGPVPSGLYETCWGPWAGRGELEVVRHDGAFIDCGTPADYLAANLAVSGGRPVIGAGATVEGRVERSVVWDGAAVASGEVLQDAIRTTAGLTVLVR